MKEFITESHAEEVLKLTQTIISETGPRLAGTPECKKAAEIIYNNLDYNCDSAKMEKFDFHRDAFLVFMKIMATTYVIFLFCLFIGGNSIYLAAICLFIGGFITITEFVFYKEIIDKFFKRMAGYNVVGTIDPQKDVKQNIIISAHHDSAYVFNFFKKWQKVYAPRITIGIVLYFTALFFSLGMAISKIFIIGTNHLFAFTVPMQYIFAAGAVFVIQFYFFKSKQVSTGAGDNLISSVIGIKLAEIFGNAKKDGKPLLEHTRLIILSLDAEEAGLRGARDYAKRHKEELRSIPTFNFNIESVYNANELSFLTSDINGTVRLSKNMANQCKSIVKELGYKATSAPITFGGGATDAAEFAKIGVEAVTLLGMENKFIRDNLVYHTAKDTVDKIQPEAVLACLKIASQYILIKDQEIQAKKE